MSSRRLLNRTPSACFKGTAVLVGYVMRVHKRSSDGSAKCDVVQTGCMDDRTYGVLYNLEEHEMAVLDRFENAGVEYHNRPVEVVTSGGPVLARCYFAFSRTIDDSLAPYDWYMQHVLDGAVERGLPDAYVKQLQAVKCIPDPRRAEFLLAKG